MDAAPSGVGTPVCPVLEKNEVKEPCFPKKFLHAEQTVQSATVGQSTSLML